MTYHCTLRSVQDRKTTSVDMPATDAASAISKALEQYRDHVVTRCYSGDLTRAFIEYDIPNHRHIDANAPKPRRSIKPVDLTSAMFNETELSEESARAAEHARHEREKEIQSLTKPVDASLASATTAQ